MLALSTIVVPLNTTGNDFDRHADLLDHALRVARRAFVQQQRELIAAQTRENIVAAHVERHAMRDVAQQPVARFVAERIVDLLEAIEIDERDGMDDAAMFRTLERGPRSSPRSGGGSASA